MKKGFFFTLAAALMLCFTACDPDHPIPDNPGGGGNNNNYSQLIVGTWQVDNMTVDGRVMTPENLKLIFNANGTGVLNDNGVTENNEFSWSLDGTTMTIQPRSGSATYTIVSLDDHACQFTGNVVPGTDMQGDVSIHMTKIQGGDNPGPGPGPGPNPADFPAGTNWQCSLDTTVTETDDEVSYSIVVNGSIKLSFAATGNTGALIITGTTTIYYNDYPIDSESMNENQDFTWTYNETSHSGTLTASGIDEDTGEPYTESIEFYYDSSDDTIILDMPSEDEEGNVTITHTVFHRM